MNYDISLLPCNEIYYKIEAGPHIINKIRSYFSLRVPGFIFNPLYKNGLWNGFVCLFKGNYFPKGLRKDLEKFASDNHYSIYVHDQHRSCGISLEYLDELIKTTKLSSVDKKSGNVFEIQLRDYQEEAIRLCIKNQHQLIVSQTSTGKSLMIYMVMKILQEAIIFDSKMLIIVPSITLVEQMYSDFESYSRLNGWKVDDFCTKMHSKAKPDYNKQILITTWQSLMDKDEEFFKQYKAVFLDEAHKIGKSNTKEAKQIELEINKCVNAKFLFGFTGTLPEEILYRKKILGFFGNTKAVTSYSDAISTGNISDLEINILELEYTSGFDGSMRNYKNEKSFIMSSQRRNEFLKKLMLKNNGNQLLLFMEIKKHAKVIYESIINDERFKDYKIILLDSTSKVSVREDTKKLLETNDKVIVFGTYALLGTGWSVNNIWNIIFVAPLKSKIAVLQSIGRGLRLIPGQKKVCKIWDIVDKFEYKNILYKHYLTRYKYYAENKFNMKVYHFKNEVPRSGNFGNWWL